eukprot:3311332-Ditylum_brightwellii.AAC.1
MQENSPFGDTLQETKSEHSIRIWLQHQNGLRIGKGMEKVKTIMEIMEYLDIDVLAIPEINNLWTKEVQHRCHTYGRKILGTFWKVGSSSDEISPSLYKPGGVAMFCKGQITGRIYKMGSNDKGLG